MMNMISIDMEVPQDGLCRVETHVEILDVALRSGGLKTLANLMSGADGLMTTSGNRGEANQAATASCRRY